MKTQTEQVQIHFDKAASAESMVSVCCLVLIIWAFWQKVTMSEFMVQIQ